MSSLIEHGGFGHSQEIRKAHKPCPSSDDVVRDLKRHWGFSLEIDQVRQLDSYDDANFYVNVISSNGSSDEYLVKYYNRIETDDPSLLRGLSRILQILGDKVDGYHFPNIFAPLSTNEHPVSEDFVYIPDILLADQSRATVLLRVFHWIRGRTMNSTTTTESMLSELGCVLACMKCSLMQFDEPCFHRDHLWDLRCFHQSLPLISCVDDEDVRSSILLTQDAYNQLVLPNSDKLPKSVIMGDANDANIIVNAENGKIAGLIDFSDAVYTWSVNELAICMAYMLLTPLGQKEPLVTVKLVLSGYLQKSTITPLELEALPILIAVRLSISIMVGAYSIAREPNNEYLRLHAMPARTMLNCWCRLPWKQLEGELKQVLEKTNILDENM
jgi:hypothetical protein